ncbi:Cthe_2314 family HEPN domain-containing protein [Aeromonas veronii]|uniref:Cthe_2314 family HEPN domain-containing protein n=1 Tax=Aeromonas veronii TaxID=654 RepID=UPI001F3361EC|nr:Cthe_2314 family HEPN domain-containing protein [Aeromonas veronii]MCF7743780.1 hypothetical protein [Aeromonas veronii]
MRKLDNTVHGKFMPYLLHKYGANILRKSKGYEKYVVDTAVILGNVSRSEEKLKLSLMYIKANKDIKSIDYDLTKEKLIEFTIEDFVVRSISVFDRVLSLINCVLELRIPKKKIAFVSVNSKIRKHHPDLSVSLKELKKITSKYLSDRNSIIHESTYTDRNLVKLQLISDHIQTNLLRGVEQVFDLEVLNIDSNSYIDGKLQEFDEHILNVESAITKITNLLDSEFTKKLTHIRSKEAQT